jgi:hypothetical protein
VYLDNHSKLFQTINEQKENNEQETILPNNAKKEIKKREVRHNLQKQRKSERKRERKRK